MNAFVRWCLERRSVVLLTAVLVVAAGAYGATQLRQQLFPEINFPFLSGSVAVPGVGAKQVDEQVAQELERSLRNVDEVEAVQTVANEGQATVLIELAYGTDVDSAREDVLAAMQEVDLPPEAEEIEVDSAGFTEQPIMNVSLASDDEGIVALSDRAEELEKDIESIEGVARVDVAGTAQPQYDVRLRRGALEQGLTPASVATLIEGAELAQAAGAVDAAGARTPLTVEGTGVDTLKRLRSLPVDSDRELRDIATIERRGESGDSFARTNGKSSISLSVFRVDRANEVAVVDEAEKVLDGARRDVGSGNVTTISENATDVKQSIRGLLLEGTLGALFAVLVIFAFLRSLRATLVAAVAIPTSIVFGLLAAWGLGLTLNIITLAGLTIAIGRVIDDAIVVLENIHKHLERGEPRLRAAIDGTTEVSLAIASSTIATAAVFLPIGLVGGLISEIFLSFSIIVVAALLASLLVAVTLIPALAAIFLRPRTELSEGRTRLARIVTPITGFGLRHRFVTIALALALFAGAVGGIAAGVVPIQFLPEGGTQQVYGNVDLPAGTSTARARELLRPLDRSLAKVDGVEDYQVAYGDAALQTDIGQSANGRVTFFLTLAEGTDPERAANGLREFGEREYPQGFEVQQLEEGPPAGAFEATILGDDESDVVRATRRVDRLLKQRSDVIEVSSPGLQEQSQFVVSLNGDAREQGYDSRQVTQALAATIAPADAGMTDDDVGIVVRVPSKLISNTGALERLPLPAATGASAAGGGAGAPPSAPSRSGGAAAASSAGAQAAGAGGAGAGARTGDAAAAASGAGRGGGSTATRAPETVRIGDIGEVERRSERATATRVDGDIAGVINAKILGEDTNKTIEDVKADVAALDLENVRVEYGGDAEFLEQMFSDLLLAMLVAIVLVYVVLVLFFGSIAQPITILAPILLSTIGSLGGLILTGRALGLPAMIGQLLLIGIVVANSILVVDTALRMRRQGIPRNEALGEAARLRVRPVLMTAVATIAALTPLALGISGEGGIISQSLGTVVIGGLLTATLLTLVIVPAVFTLFDRDRGHADPDDEGEPAVRAGATRGVEPRAYASGSTAALVARDREPARGATRGDAGRPSPNGRPRDWEPAQPSQDGDLRIQISTSRLRAEVTRLAAPVERENGGPVRRAGLATRLRRRARSLLG